jgi:hypothetical protein
MILFLKILNSSFQGVFVSVASGGPQPPEKAELVNNSGMVLLAMRAFTRNAPRIGGHSLIHLAGI